MRIKIVSTDRIGISQEILAVFAQQSWDLKAVEITTRVAFVHIQQSPLTIAQVRLSLEKIDGIISCDQIERLPMEERENHLRILLDRIQDPIIDIDKKGIVLAVNRAIKHIFNGAIEIGHLIYDFIDEQDAALFADKVSISTLTFNGYSYIADITPVLSSFTQDSTEVVGAVITLRTSKTLGRQISLLQGQQQQGLESIIGKSAKIRALMAQTIRYAELELPVLITGETGTGKELVARALHHTSSRSKAPFLAINCASLSEQLLESELFGYAAGAFTGAQKGGKPGLIELANGGTLFLDEIAEMSVYLQAKFLRFLQDFKYRRVGGTKELVANVRIISASHQNLTEQLEKKHFREDLYYRLNVLNLVLPPLRERSEDIPLLVEHFIKNAASQVDQIAPEISEQALNMLIDYAWPGNIRQLQNILFRVVALDEKQRIDQHDIMEVLSQFNINKTEMTKNELANSVNTQMPDMDKALYTEIKNWASAQAKFEYQLLTQLYPLYPTTRKLAQRLGVSHNKIAVKLREHGIRDA